MHVPDLTAIPLTDLLSTEEAQEAGVRLDTRSVTVVPLLTHGRTFGALALLNTGERPPLTEPEIAEATEVARRAAVPLDNARLHDKQSKLVETFQRSLLAEPPRVDGLEIAVRYRPASSFQQVGGDWYDVFGLPDGATSLVIGDVVGHSVEAAAAMSQIHGIVRTVACEQPSRPCESLARVDRVLTQLDVDALASVLLARLEPEVAGTRTLCWSSAGHPPPVLLRHDGTLRVLDAPSDLLLGTDLIGALSPGRRETHETVLDPGDTVLLYTDGLVEIGRMDIGQGIRELTAALDELHGQSPDELCTRLLQRLAPGRTDDDIALLAVRVTG